MPWPWLQANSNQVEDSTVTILKLSQRCTSEAAKDVNLRMFRDIGMDPPLQVYSIHIHVRAFDLAVQHIKMPKQKRIGGEGGKEIQTKFEIICLHRTPRALRIRRSSGTPLHIAFISNS